MAIFDIILLCLLGGFIFFGLWFGAIHTVGALAGAFLGAYCAGLWYEPFGAYLQGIFGYPNLMRIFAFILIFILINRLVGFVFYLIDKVFHIIAIIPFLKTINRLIGGLLGLVEGVLVIGLCLFFIARFPLSDWFSGILTSSAVAPWFIKMSGILQAMLPEILKQIHSVI